MRQVEEGAAIGAAFTRFVDTCVQCRACETACPSSVPFGRLMEGTRAAMAASGGVRTWQRAAYGILGRHRLLLALSTAGAVAQRARLIPARLDRRLSPPRLPLRQRRLRSSGGDVLLFTGCVMDAWQRRVHGSVKSVIEATGAGVGLPGPGADCCGALHVHAGLVDQAKGLARRVIAAMPGEAPVLVDSAGCGAVMKDYGTLLGTPEAAVFARRVFDVHEWLAARSDSLPPAVRPLGVAVAVQDPCHLRHAQQSEAGVRAVLRGYAELVELDDEGRCCGAGGAYSALQPALAGAIRAQKLASIERSGATLTASANPGCIMWLSAAGAEVRHPLELVAFCAGLEDL
jgi:glycolate oxidase iron-sulfur subunit